MTNVRDSQMSGSYNSLVRALFRNPRHATDNRAIKGCQHEARVCDSGSGAKIVLRAITDKGVLSSLRFRVFGCPHLIAAAESSCERFEGGPVNDLSNFDVPHLMETLGIPVEKMGRILLLEDAIRSLCSQIGLPAKNKD
jgi:NifU-like protein involved in Fe-S cluster formation